MDIKLYSKIKSNTIWGTGYQNIVNYLYFKDAISDDDTGVVIEIRFSDTALTIHNMLKIATDANTKVIVFVNKDNDDSKNKLIDLCMNKHKTYKEIDEFFYSDTRVFIKDN